MKTIVAPLSGLLRRLPAVPSLRVLIAGAALAGTGAMVATVLLLQPSPEVEASAPQPALVVALSAPRVQLWPSTVEASGGVAAWQETIIGGQIGGLQLLEVTVNVGDRVRRGQLLARFDATSPRAELARLVAALGQADAAAAQAAANRVRAESLADSGAISDQEVLRFITEANAAEAAVEAAKAAVAAQREQLRYVEVKASDDGVIVSRAATVGSVGGVGQELFRLIRQGRLEWRGEVTAEQLARIVPGAEVDLALPGGEVAKARIRQEAPMLDPQTRLGLIYADIGQGGGVRAGMYVRGRIELAPSPALTVPASSIVLRDGRNYQFGVERAGDRLVVRQHEVMIGRRRGGEVELTSSAASGRKFIVSGGGFLKAGDLVREGRASASVGRRSEGAPA